MNVSESNAVFTLLAWVGHLDRTPPGPADVADALALLGERAGRTLLLPQSGDDIAAAVERFTGTAGDVDLPAAGSGGDGVAFYAAARVARDGERCMCGRPAVVVHEDDELGEVGYCGRAGAAQVVPCVFCKAERRHQGGRCPHYRLNVTEPAERAELEGAS